MDDIQLDNFLLMSAENIKSTPALNLPTYRYLKEIDEHWLRLLFGEPPHRDNRVVLSLITNGHHYFRACISLIAAGHPTPVYPLFRTSLESCLYALMIATKPELENIWVDRGKNESSKDACRKEFSARKMFNCIEAQNPELAKDCGELYEMYIDYGAHPNIHGTLTFIQPGPDGDLSSVSIGYLQGNERETRIAAFQAVQVAEVALHLAIQAIPHRASDCGTEKFLTEFSPRINRQVFGL